MNQNSFEILPETVNLLLNENMHGREIAERLQAPLGSVQRVLRRLEEESVIGYETRGRNKIYRLKRNIMVRRYVLDAEHYKLHKLIKRRPAMQPILEKLARLEADIVLIFGSYAKGSEDKDSDIDVFLETKDTALKKEAEGINTRISAKTGELKKDDPLVREIMKNHIILKGVERYHERSEIFG